MDLQYVSIRDRALRPAGPANETVVPYDRILTAQLQNGPFPALRPAVPPRPPAGASDPRREAGRTVSII